jgi:SAM-dependent methyltransferase
MSEGAKPESQTQIIDGADAVLTRAGLTWKDLEHKTVLDGGAGEAYIARAAEGVGSTAKIYSVDARRRSSWAGFPSDGKVHALEALVQELPFPDNTFDLIINSCSVDASEIKDEARVLRPGGEIRITPIVGQILDLWNVGCYLQEVKGVPAEKVVEKLIQFEQSMNDNEGWRPSEYAQLEKDAIHVLTQAQKLQVIDSLVKRFTDFSGLPLSYVIWDRDAREPDGYIIYTKPVNGY